MPLPQTSKTIIRLVVYKSLANFYSFIWFIYLIIHRSIYFTIFTFE